MTHKNKKVSNIKMKPHSKMYRERDTHTRRDSRTNNVRQKNCRQKTLKLFKEGGSKTMVEFKTRSRCHERIFVWCNYALL